MKSVKSYFAFSILLILFVTGCAANTAPSTSKQTNNLNQNSSQNTTIQDYNQELRQCDQVIDYKTLITALPDNVKGYTAGTPEGNVMTFTDPSDKKEIRYSVASNIFTKDDHNIDISIMDTCYIQYLSMDWIGFYESEGTNGFFRKVDVKGNPGWHQYDAAAGSYSYTISVKDRILITVTGQNGVPDGDVTDAVNAIDYTALSDAVR